MPLHVKIKLFLKNILPTSVYKQVLTIWRNTLATFFTNTTNTDVYYNQYIESNGLIVSNGPFTGMRYIPESAGSVLLHKLVGYYEEILHTTIADIQRNNFDTIIDIGVAEGYYLAGLGRHFSSAHLVGFDIDERALSLTKKLVAANNISNKITLETDCTPEKLQSMITDETLIICDAEGFEAIILDPEKIPALSKTKELVIETHEFAAPHVIKTLVDRFSSTHTIEHITFKMADYTRYPFLQAITNKKDLYQLLRERGEQEQVWLVMKRR